MLALSIAHPLLFYIARPIAAARFARKYPVRQVALTPEAIEVAAGAKKGVIAWGRIKHVWRADDYLLLVLGKYGNIAIPSKSLPPGAEEFINANAKRTA